tara:strand:+ start:1560 stop:2729 length:1170 start_codon:yes stop_codon:yes gene_type:complete
MMSSLLALLVCGIVLFSRPLSAALVDCSPSTPGDYTNGDFNGCIIRVDDTFGSLEGSTLTNVIFASTSSNGALLFSGDVDFSQTIFTDVVFEGKYIYFPPSTQFVGVTWTNVVFSATTGGYVSGGVFFDFRCDFTGANITDLRFDFLDSEVTLVNNESAVHFMSSIFSKAALSNIGIDVRWGADSSSLSNPIVHFSSCIFDQPISQLDIQIDSNWHNSVGDVYGVLFSGEGAYKALALSVVDVRVKGLLIGDKVHAVAFKGLDFFLFEHVNITVDAELSGNTWAKGIYFDGCSFPSEEIMSNILMTVKGNVTSSISASSAVQSGRSFLGVGSYGIDVFNCDFTSVQLQNAVFSVEAQITANAAAVGMVRRYISDFLILLHAKLLMFSSL